MGAGPRMEAWGDTATECGEGPISYVQPDKMGLPKLNNAGAVLKKDEGPGVFSMHVHTSSGGKVRLVIEAPIFSADATAKGLSKCQVSLDPGNSMQFMSQTENDGPKITVLPWGHGMGLEKSM